MGVPGTKSFFKWGSLANYVSVSGSLTLKCLRTTALSESSLLNTVTKVHFNLYLSVYIEPDLCGLVGTESWICFAKHPSVLFMSLLKYWQIKKKQQH